VLAAGVAMRDIDEEDVGVFARSGLQPCDQRALCGRVARRRIQGVVVERLRSTVTLLVSCTRMRSTTCCAAM